jgi:hypothetical protein
MFRQRTLDFGGSFAGAGLGSADSSIEVLWETAGNHASLTTDRVPVLQYTQDSAKLALPPHHHHQDYPRHPTGKFAIAENCPRCQWEPCYLESRSPRPENVVVGSFHLLSYPPEERALTVMRGIEMCLKEKLRRKWW